jgi:hypothetical protein
VNFFVPFSETVSKTIAETEEKTDSARPRSSGPVMCATPSPEKCWIVIPQAQRVFLITVIRVIAIIGH